MKTCTNCVMPETAESLSYDDKGKCSVCEQIKYKKDKINVFFESILDFLPYLYFP